MKSQSQEILSMLKRGPVTPMDALREIGCFRLAARVYDLRHSGHKIHTDMVTVEEKTFAQYSID